MLPFRTIEKLLGNQNSRLRHSRSNALIGIGQRAVAAQSLQGTRTDIQFPERLLTDDNAWLDEAQVCGYLKISEKTLKPY